MPTKKEVFIDLMNLLKTNISEVSNRVYSSYPKKKITLPFIVLSDIRRSQNTITLTKEIVDEVFVVNITVYTKTAQQLDELSDSIYSLVQTTPIHSFKPNMIEDVDSAEVIDENNKVIHYKTIAVTYRY